MSLILIMKMKLMLLGEIKTFEICILHIIIIKMLEKREKKESDLKWIVSMQN